MDFQTGPGTGKGNEYGQLDDAHSLPIAEAKAALSLEVMISLRNKAMESYSELIKMNV